MRYFLEFAYNGKNYHGWQMQSNASSIQEVLNKSLSMLLKAPIYVVGAGRTDTGVHANQMFCHFDVEHQLPDDFLKRINAMLPPDILILDSFRVKDGVSSRFDAKSREYKYFIITTRNPFKQEVAYYFHRLLDINLMNKACRVLRRHDDFECFSKSNTQVTNYLCKITKAKWERKGDELVFTIEANRFLRNMVRAIVGTMIDIGLGRTSIEDFELILRSRDRSRAGYSVPAKGLFLNKIKYNKTIRY